MISKSSEPTPASIYLNVSPDFKVTYLRQSDCGWLFSFLEQEVSMYRRNDAGVIPDNWLIEYRFKDRNLIPLFSNRDNSDYLSRLLPVVESLDIWPTHIVRLRDAIFCERHGLDPLSEWSTHEHLLVHPHFTKTENLMNDKLIQKKNYEFPCWKALKCERGVLLFSDSGIGKNGYSECRKYITDNFFNPGFHMEFMDIYRIPAFMTTYLPYVDRFHDLYINRTDEQRQIADIPKEVFAPGEIVKSGFLCKHFDMKRTSENFRRCSEDYLISVSNSKCATYLSMYEFGEYRPVIPSSTDTSPISINEILSLYPRTHVCPNEGIPQQIIREYGLVHLQQEFPDFYNLMLQQQDTTQEYRQHPKLKL